MRILLWPLSKVLELLFPLHDYDGLSPAVTAKAAEAFSAYLTKVQPSVSQLPWATMGFSACKAEAIQTNALLLIYLHAPLHRNADEVATTFCREEIVTILAEPHLLPLGISIHSGQGAHLAQLLNAAAYPLVAMLQPSRGSNSMEIILKIQGPVLVDMATATLARHLRGALQRHQHVLAEQETRRLQREQDALLRAEQDAAYHAALEADRQREREMEQERERIRQEQEDQEATQLRELQKKENRLDTARALLREEPISGSVAQIRFVLPSGKKVGRKFGSDETIEVLRAFLTVYFHDEGMPEMTNIGLSTNYPKKTFNTGADEAMSLDDAGLAPQAVLMVQDLDA
jgi:FAS-associated factor 2